MPIVFEEITGEVAPARGTGGEAQAQPESSPQPDLGEMLQRELQLARERERRLLAD